MTTQDNQINSKELNDSHNNFIPKSRETLIFGFGFIGIMPYSYFLLSLLLIYGVSMLGLPALFVGTVFSISQIIYALILPIFGNLSDFLVQL